MELNLGQSVLPEVHYFTLAAVCLRASHTTSDFLGRAGKRGSKGRAPSERRREHHGGKCFGNGKAPPKPQLWLLLQECALQASGNWLGPFGTQQGTETFAPLTQSASARAVVTRREFRLETKSYMLTDVRGHSNC